MAPGDEQPDPQRVIDLLEAYLLGSGPTLTGPQIAEDVGIDIETTRRRWRSLGFTAVDDDEVAFTARDLEAMRLTQRLHELGLVDDADESAMIRTLGRSFARLAEWQLDLLGQTVDPREMDLDQVAEVITEVVPLIEEVQNYVWRRHVLNAAARLLLTPPAGDDAPEQGIGFADIVGYTRQSRSLSQEELTRLVDEFEARALAIVTQLGGRIIKTIGDEVLYAADIPHDAAEIALRLVEGHVEDEDFPELRVGVSWGPVLNRLGDVFGPTVNVASRLTSLSRPGRVLVDKELAEQLAGDETFRLRRTRRTAVRGYRRLEPWALRRPHDEEESPVTAFLQQKGQDLLRVVDEMQARIEGPSGGEGADQRPHG